MRCAWVVVVAAALQCCVGDEVIDVVEVSEAVPAAEAEAPATTIGARTAAADSATGRAGDVAAESAAYEESASPDMTGAPPMSAGKVSPRF